MARTVHDTSVMHGSGMASGTAKGVVTMTHGSTCGSVALALALALGVWAGRRHLGGLAPPVLLAGVAVHGWGMTAVHRRNNGLR